MRGLALPLALAAVLIAPAAAQATDFCVAPNTTCGGTNVATLEVALATADNAVDADRVFLGAATYTAPVTTGFDYNAAGFPVEIIGAGVGQTVLTGPAGSSRVLRLQGGNGSLLRDISVALPANVLASAVAIDLADPAIRVAVTANATQTNAHRGVDIQDGGSFDEGSVTLSQAIGNVTGILVMSTSNASVTRSAITARNGVQVNPGASGTVHRSTATSSSAAVGAVGGTVTVTSSILRPVTGGTGLSVLDQPGDPGVANANGVTIVGDDSNGSVGAFVVEFQGDTATINITNSIIRVVDQALGRAAGAGTANLTATFSDFDPTSIATNTGTGTMSPAPGLLEPGSNVNVDPQFTNPASDFRLLAGSPVIDAGDPATAAGLDFDGNTLLTDGNGDGSARRDMGAFERAAAAPPGPGPGPAPGGSDPGPGPGAGTPPADVLAPVISSLRASPDRVRSGRRPRLLFTLDEAATVTVVLRRAAAGRRQGSRCSRPTRRNRGGRRCTRYVRVTTVSLALPAGDGSVRLPARLRGRRLAPGRYRALVTAADAAGNRSAAKTARLRVVRP